MVAVAKVHRSVMNLTLTSIQASGKANRVSLCPPYSVAKWVMKDTRNDGNGRVRGLREGWSPAVIVGVMMLRKVLYITLKSSSAILKHSNKLEAVASFARSSMSPVEGPGRIRTANHTGDGIGAVARSILPTS